MRLDTFSFHNKAVAIAIEINHSHYFRPVSACSYVCTLGFQIIQININDDFTVFINCSIHGIIYLNDIAVDRIDGRS